MSKSAAPLLLAGGAALIFMGGKKKRNGKKGGKGACPPIAHVLPGSIPTEKVHVKYSDGGEGEIGIPRVAYHEALDGNREIINITKKVVAPVLPEDCIASESIKVDIVVDNQRRELSAVEYFFLMAAEVTEDLLHTGLFTQEEADFSLNEISKWWVSKMGTAPFPQD